ncbi:MAG: DUF6266 family protein [Aquaticitalea sp.]
MATYSDGPLGGFSGKLGPVVGYKWRGMEVLRSAPEKPSKPATEAQLLQRRKFKDALTFLNPISPLMTKTFRAFPSDKNGFESAKSYHLKEAMQINGSIWDIIYPKVLISAGSLRGLTDPNLQVASNETLRLQWINDSGQAMANTSDTLLFVMYLPTLNQFEVFKNVASREVGHADIVYPSYYISLEAQCWASFGTATGSKYAVSTYLGAVVL